MVRPFDISKFRKVVTKEITGASIGFHDPKTWVSTGNYCLNYRISGDFTRGVPMGKVTVFAGESGSGKSFLTSGNIVREAQKMGIYVVLIDSENALDEEWLKALGVDTDESKLLKINVAMIDEVAKIISEFMKDYKSSYGSIDPDDRPKVMFCIDSLGMLLTPTDLAQFDKGEMKGDMGRKPRQLKSLVTNCVNMFGEWEVGMVATNHTYQSQDMFNPDDVVSGGGGFVYASSILVAMRKLKLKEDEDGNKTTTVQGIRAKCKVMKTRFNKPFEEVEIKIPYDRGMDAYSGLTDMFEAMGILTKDGNRLTYNPLSGEPIKKFRKGYESNDDGILDLMMLEFPVRHAADEAALMAAQKEQDRLEQEALKDLDSGVQPFE